MNDNRKPMSKLGQALFDMLADMNSAQSRIYCSQGSGPKAENNARIEVERLEKLHRSRVLLTIRRPSEINKINVNTEF
jgi:hypothetical protein